MFPVFFGRPNHYFWLKVLGILSFALTKPISSGEGSFAGAQWQQSVLNYGEADLIGERMENDRSELRRSLCSPEHRAAASIRGDTFICPNR